jgi:hypothetical protein
MTPCTVVFDWTSKPPASAAGPSLIYAVKTAPHPALPIGWGEEGIRSTEIHLPFSGSAAAWRFFSLSPSDGERFS